MTRPDREKRAKALYSALAQAASSADPLELVQTISDVQGNSTWAESSATTRDFFRQLVESLP